MFPTQAIEYLLSITRPGGGRLVVQEATQILIPIFPPGTLSLIAHPIAGDYGRLFYGLAFGSNMVPNAFTGYIQVWGARQITGTLTSKVLEIEFQSFFWATQAEPSLMYLTNVSGLNQVFELDSVSLRISSEDDYKLVLEALARLGTSAKLEQLAQEANELLSKLVGVAPPPPGVVPG